MGHVLKNVGGVYESPKSVEQEGEVVYEPTPKAKQKEAVDFLNKQLFETPEWLVNKEILNLINNPVSSDMVTNVQVNILNSLLSVSRMNRMSISATRFGAANVYPLEVMMDDLKNGVWSELSTHKTIDGYRRNLQKAYIDALSNIINPQPPAPGQPAQAIKNNTWNTDAVSVARAQLVALKRQVDGAIPSTSDKMSKYHLMDISDRIKKSLDPNG
jgi:hypothetical protein